MTKPPKHRVAEGDARRPALEGIAGMDGIQESTWVGYENSEDVSRSPLALVIPGPDVVESAAAAREGDQDCE